MRERKVYNENVQLDFYGLTCNADSESKEVLSGLERDFAYFVTPFSQSAPDFKWELFLTSPPLNSKRFLGIPLRDFKVYSKRGVRHIQYDKGAALATFNFKTGRGSIYCADRERLHELAYLAILSRVGEALDRRGLHRVHALGFEWQGSGGILLLPSGGGKSTLALELLRSQAPVGFFSEDTPLICRHGLLHAFPLRWSFRPGAKLDWVPENFIRSFHRKNYGDKLLLDVDFFIDKIRREVPLRWVIVGQRTFRDQSMMTRSSFFLGLKALFVNLVVGLGVPQMAEYRIRWGVRDIFFLLKDAFSRLRVLMNITQKTQVYFFEMGNNPQESASVLLEFLNSERTSKDSLEIVKSKNA